jgi:class 3 adenylate cyclase
MAEADAEALASFLPDRLVRRLIERPEPTGRPNADRLVGALLLADISGFTAITERLARHGPGGAEELRGLLDGAFGPLLELIAISGGDVLKFAGDALLACWPAREETDPALAAAAAMAAGCAEAMQAELRRFAAVQGLPLSLRIGVGAGELTVLDVGGARDRRELLVTGTVVPQTTAATAAAKPGRVVLSAPARGLLGRAEPAGEPPRPAPRSTGGPPRRSPGPPRRPALRRHA